MEMVPGESKLIKKFIGVKVKFTLEQATKSQGGGAEV